MYPKREFLSDEDEGEKESKAHKSSKGGNGAGGPPNKRVKIMSQGKEAATKPQQHSGGMAFKGSSLGSQYRTAGGSGSSQAPGYGQSSSNLPKSSSGYSNSMGKPKSRLK
jgi:hypothetical protein